MSNSDHCNTKGDYEEVEEAGAEGDEELVRGSGDDACTEVALDIQTTETIADGGRYLLKSPGGIINDGRFDFGLCSASATRRKMLSQLCGVLGLRRAAARSGADEAEAEAEATAMAEAAKAEAESQPAVRAIRRINRLRLRHPQCKPLALNDTYCEIAAIMAQEMAAREAIEGLTEELQINAESSTVEMPDSETDEQMGVVISRLAVSDLDALPVVSVNDWYSDGCLLEQLSVDDVSQTKYRRYIQLVDGNSRRMGWASAVVDDDSCEGCAGVAYAVAVFDNPVVCDDEALKNMRPPITDFDPHEDF